MSSGGYAVFVRVFGRLRACRAGPRASPGAWACPVSRLLPIPGERPGRVKDRAKPGRRSRRRRRP